MKGDWKGADLKTPIPGLGKLGRDPNGAEPVYHTERYVAPSLIYLPKEEVMSPQWWRGGKLFTKNPPYHNRDDFTKENPIGQ